jgi:tetratricopeptide (TPR) repeat protein
MVAKNGITAFSVEIRKDIGSKNAFPRQKPGCVHEAIQPFHPNDMTAPLRYRAFISYSHRDSRKATRLHHKLEAYRVPKVLRSGSQTDGEHHPGRIRPVFRDRDDLSTSTSLTQSIEEALDASEALVVICSPDAVSSRWVNEEIRYFRQQHPDRPVLAFVVRGDPIADPILNPAKAAFPINLLLSDVEQPQGSRNEPLAADARHEADGFPTAFLKLAAGLIGVNYDRLRQRELHRRQRHWVFVGSFSLLLAVVFAMLAWRATVARNEAQAARSQAELELLSERQTRNFLLSAFKLADPGEARGTTVTVREVLDSAVARIDSTEFARPVIKSRFLATMGQAYSSLGMNHRSVELLHQSLQALPGGELSTASWIQRIDSQLELSDVLFSMGEYDEALAMPGEVESVKSASHLTSQQHAQAANIRGDILSYMEQDTAAMESYRSALSIIDTASLSVEENATIRSRSLGGIAILYHFAGDYEASQRYYSEAVNILLPVFGEMHPDTIWAMISWGSAAYFNGDTQSARDVWTRSLAIAQQVLDETHPEVGTIKNNLARLLFETGEYAEAEVLLRDALAIDRNHRDESFDDLAYPLNTLALVRMAQQDVGEATALWREALPIAEAAAHQMLGPILAGLADVLCQEGQTVSGIEMALRAVTVNQAEFGEGDWHSRRAILALAYCRELGSQGHNVEEIDREEVKMAQVVIVERWGEESYFSQRAAKQLDVVLKAKME